MRFDKWLIAILVFSLFIVAGSLIYGDMISTYDINASTDAVGANFSSTYDTIDDIYITSEEMKNDTFGTEIEGGDESWTSMVKGGYTAIKLITGSFTLVGDVLDAIIQQIGLPPFFKQAAIAAIVIMLVAGILFMIFRFKEGA